MMRKVIVSVILVCLFTFTAVADDGADKKTTVPATTKIGFDQSFSPLTGYTLSSYFSKLKNYLEGEFDCTVTSHSGWYNLSQFDIYIIPGGCQSVPDTGSMTALKNWVKQGGSLIFLWHWTGFNWYPDYWHGGVALHDNVLEHFGMQIKGMDAGATDMVSFAGTIGSDPYNINKVVGGAKPSYMHAVYGNAKFLAWNSNGNPVASYNPKANNGKLYLIGNEHNFKNSYIDQQNNKKFLFNLIKACGAGNGGGGGGGGNDAKYKIKKTKGKPRVVAPGNDLKLIVVVINKSGVNKPATAVNMYLSKDKTLDAGDRLLAALAIPALNHTQKKKVTQIVTTPNIDSDYYYVIGEMVGTTKITASRKTIELR